ncbi:MAG: hypothetical protein PF489_06050 [Salinivirgaceae bacterium]|jgi:hypothetical protein|nr:hypothetical protein [Salinivirgaceae bacterium]
MLTQEQTTQIIADVSNANIYYSHLRDDLIDHICCDIEHKMRQGYNFSDAYNKVQERIGYKGLKQIQNDTFFLIDKTYRNMKKLMKIVGLAAPVLLGVGSMFKILHWPGASILLLLGFFVLCFLFLPTSIYIFYKETRSSKNVLLFLSGFIASIAISVGVLFKVQHWPYAQNLLLGGFAVLLLIFLPTLLWVNYRKDPRKIPKSELIIGFLALLFFIGGYLFKIQHWPGASVLILLGNVLLFFIAVPLYCRALLREKQFVSGKVIFTILAAAWLVITFNLISLKTSNRLGKNYEALYSQLTHNAELLRQTNTHFYNHANFDSNAQYLQQLRVKTEEVVQNIGKLKNELFNTNRDANSGAMHGMVEDYIHKGVQKEYSSRFRDDETLSMRVNELKEDLNTYSQFVLTSLPGNFDQADIKAFRQKINSSDWEERYFEHTVAFTLEYLAMLTQQVYMIESELLYYYHKTVKLSEVSQNQL